MVVPFGVGVGDFLAVAKLTGKVVSELKENGEAPKKYQNIVIELEALGRALSQVYEVKPAEDGVALLDATRAAATACKRPLEDFLERVSKFDKSLGTWDAKERTFKGIGRRIQFSLALDKEVAELRAALAGHVSTINMLLLIQTLAFDTTQQKERTETSKSLDEQYQCLNKLLGEVSAIQSGTSARLSAYKDDLDEMMGRMKISSIQNADTQLKLDEQKATLDEVRSDIDRLNEKLEREQAQVQSRNRAGRKDLDKAISALAVTSTIFTLVVSGTIFVSVHDIATQAADLSRLLGNQIKKGKRTSSVLIRTGSSGAYSDMGLKECRTMSVPTASVQEIDFVRNSPKRERQSQDLTVSAEEDLGLFEKAWDNPDRLSKGKDSAPMDSHFHHSIGLGCFLRQLPPADLVFIVRFEIQNQCDRGHYFRWRNHCLTRIDNPENDLSVYEYKTALVSIAHLDDFERLRSQIQPSGTESAADLFRDWVILKLDHKDGISHYVITVATDEYHIAKSDPGLRISRVEYDNTPQNDDQLDFDTKESTVSGLVQDLPSLLATTIVSLPAFFNHRYIEDRSCTSVFAPWNWPAYNEDLHGCLPERAIGMTIYYDRLRSIAWIDGLSHGHYGTFLTYDGAKQEGRT